MNWKINFRCHPWIHEEDARAAVHTHLHESRKNRLSRISEQVIVEDLFIASLANRHQWEQAEIDQIAKSSVDKGFRERFARAIEQGKSPTFDNIDILFLENWRELHINPEIKKLIEAQEGKLPGLKDWSPLAIEGLFALAKIEANSEEGNFDDWFRKRRARLGLRGNKPYQIKKFIVKGDSVQILR